MKVIIVAGARPNFMKVAPLMKAIDHHNASLGNSSIKLDTVLMHTGYPVGTVPPFGHPTPIPTLLDPTVMAHPEICAGGGAHNALIRIKPRVILETAKALIITMTRMAQ